MRCSPRSSQSCVLCIATWLGAVVWLAVRSMPEPAVILMVYGGGCLAAYLVLTRDSAPMQVGLAFISAAFAASCGRIVLGAYVGFIMCVLHVMQAMLILELERLGDCQRCLQEASHCGCGRAKVALPAGALADAAIVIQNWWRYHRAASIS